MDCASCKERVRIYIKELKAKRKKSALVKELALFAETVVEME